MCLVQKHKLDFTKMVFLGEKENFYNSHLNKRKTCYSNKIDNFVSMNKAASLTQTSGLSLPFCIFCVFSFGLW